MTIRIGINGFGRIGRAVLRMAYQQYPNQGFEIVHINDLSSPEVLAHLLKYDSVHGALDRNVCIQDSSLSVNGHKISLSTIKNPAEIPWREKKVDIVLECTGFFRKREDCLLHIKAGAPKVLISAPGVDEDITVVYGVNHHNLTTNHQIVSNGSCTTNCLALPTKVLHDNFEIVSGLVSTVHSYTNDQNILDVPHSDFRRARAAAINMIPTTTGAAKAIGLVLPELAGKIDGLAIRVPTANVSLVDATFELAKNVSVQEVNIALEKAAQGPMKGIMSCTNEELVSQDFNGNTHSSIVDLPMTKVINDRQVKVLSWYDNEIGFSSRMLDITKLMCL